MTSSLFLCQQAGGERGLRAVPPLVFAFIIVKDPQSRRKPKKLVRRQTKFRSSRVLVLLMVLDQKGFIHQDSARFQGLQQGREDRAGEIKKYENGLIPFFGQIGGGDRRLLNP